MTLALRLFLTKKKFTECQKFWPEFKEFYVLIKKTTDETSGSFCRKKKKEELKVTKRNNEERNELLHGNEE